MKIFAVPESFEQFLKEEMESNKIDRNSIDLRSFFQYILEHSSKILYNTDFDNEFSNELLNYVILLYGGQDSIRSPYIKRNLTRIAENILRLIQDINSMYSLDLFSYGKYPVVLNASSSRFTVEYSDVSKA